jgi:UDP-N-acetylmuramoyl-L-alanyl-D-glutamate--2,6-diaminopimelate ligase
MGSVAAARADRIVLTSDNPRGEDPQAIVDAIRAGVSGDCDVALDRAQAIAAAIGSADAADVVLIAGKGHEQGQELRDRTIPFDDREVARDALRRLGAAA